MSDKDWIYIWYFFNLIQALSLGIDLTRHHYGYVFTDVLFLIIGTFFIILRARKTHVPPQNS